jgi:hypothetical protein
MGGVGLKEKTGISCGVGCGVLEACFSLAMLKRSLDQPYTKIELNYNV